jgi:hypothetical protein
MNIDLAKPRSLTTRFKESTDEKTISLLDKIPIIF